MLPFVFICLAHSFSIHNTCESCVHKVLMEVFYWRSNVNADAADVHQGSGAVACVTHGLLSKCQAKGGEATEVQLCKGQEVTLASFMRKDFLFIDGEEWMNKQPRHKNEPQLSTSGIYLDKQGYNPSQWSNCGQNSLQYFFSTVLPQCYSSMTLVCHCYSPCTDLIFPQYSITPSILPQLHRSLKIRGVTPIFTKGNINGMVALKRGVVIVGMNLAKWNVK